MTSQSRAIPVLLTRPSGSADRFANDLMVRLKDQIRVVQSPLMQPEALSPDWPDLPYGAVILTSETGALSAARLLDEGRSLPTLAYCVGDRTAEVARAAGFVAHSAQGDAEALLDMILSLPEPGPYLHLRGRDARGDLAPRLAAKGRPAHAAIVYDQRPIALTDDARALLAGHDPVIVPLFSPRTAQLFCDQAPKGAPLWIAAISQGAAKAVSGLSPARLKVAERPDAASMLAVVESLVTDPHA